VAFLGAAAFAAISLVIGARVENTESANGWMNLVQLPMWVLSGALFSHERFPEWLHPVLRALPLTALVDALRGDLQSRGLAPRMLVRDPRDARVECGWLFRVASDVPVAVVDVPGNPR